MEEIKIKVPKVEVPSHLEGEGGFNGGGNHWYDSTLWKAAEPLEEFEIPLIALNMSGNPWTMTNFRWVLYHIRRVENANLDYPILLDPDGSIADGWHRVAKAILRGDRTIKAKKFIVMPDPDIYNTSSK